MGERLQTTLTAADGNVFAASYAAPAAPVKAGVVIMPDIRGLHPYYEALAERFAEAGFAAVAMDYFGRTAGLPDGGLRSEDFEWQPHIAASSPAGVDADAAACVDFLRGRTRADLPVFTLGFCFGGAHAWRQSGSDLDIVGSIGFYGNPDRFGDQAAQARKPVLMLIAGADANIPVEAVVAMAGTMRAAGADVTDVVYDGAPHSFFDRRFADWADACQDAWSKILGFTGRLSG